MLSRKLIKCLFTCQLLILTFVVPLKTPEEKIAHFHTCSCRLFFFLTVHSVSSVPHSGGEMCVLIFEYVMGRVMQTPHKWKTAGFH